jgi:hypothetical protein
MIVLHGAVSGREFVVWGEAPPETQAGPPVKAARTKAAAPRPLPFNAGARRLAAAVDEALAGRTLGPGAEARSSASRPGSAPG